MGRKKIAIEAIEDLNKRYVAFSKRKDGLFKKAETASRMYGSTIAIFAFSPTAGKLHSFGPVDSLIHQFLLHQSSSPPPPPPHLNSTTTTTTTTTTAAAAEGKKRPRSGGDDDDDRVRMMQEERETKKRNTTTTTTEAAATATATQEEEEEEGFLLIKNSETTEQEEEEEEEEGLMMINEFMGFEQNNVTELELELEVLLGEESQSSRDEETDVDYSTIMGSSSSSTTVVTTTTTSQLVASSSSSILESGDGDGDDELDLDLDLDEVLHGFADYIITGTDHHPTTMFDLLPHQGVHDDDDDEAYFAFCDNWPTMDVVAQDQLLIS